MRPQQWKAEDRARPHREKRSQEGTSTLVGRLLGTPAEMERRPGLPRLRGQPRRGLLREEASDCPARLCTSGFFRPAWGLPAILAGAGEPHADLGWPRVRRPSAPGRWVRGLEWPRTLPTERTTAWASYSDKNEGKDRLPNPVTAVAGSTWSLGKERQPTATLRPLPGEVS